MKRIYDIIISVTAAASALCISACAEKELLPGTVEEGIPVEATLTFGAPNSDDVTVSTKAELNDYSDITSLYLFIYNTDGNKCEDVIPVAEDQISEVEINDNGRHYSTSIRTTTGTKRIFAVANYVSVESWVDFRTKIETLGSRAKDGKLTMDEVGKEIVYLRDTYINNGTTPEYPTQQMIFTSRTGGDIVTFNNDSSPNGVINLERIAANVIFNIRSGSKTDRRISFTPTSYQIYNLPKGSRLAGGRSTEDNPAEADAEFYYDGSVQTITTTSTGGTYNFDFFIPENIQKENPSVEDYNQRDEWKYNSSDSTHIEIPGSDAGTGVGSTNGEKIWKYAPENATYVVISGEYAEYKTTGSGEELLYSGNTSYVIHLGDFSTKGSFGDYSVRRNWKYTYNITVKGVNEIIAEANADKGSQGKEPGAEGGLVNISDITLSFSLDAHYEQVLLSYNLSNIVQTIKTSVEDLTDEKIIDELIGQNLILYVDSPFQAAKVTKVPYTDYIEAVKGFADPESAEAQKAAAAAKEQFLSEVDYKWVEFFPQSSSSDLSAYPGLPLWKNDGVDINSSSDLNERLLDVYDVCVKLGKVVRKLLYDEENVSTSDFAEDGITITRVSSGGSDVYYAYFTGFVDEYYYTEYPVTANGHTAGDPVAKWSEFTNKDPRRMMISMNIQVSGDGNSTYSTAHTNILQRSIQTFYDDEAADMTAFGMETFNETNAMVYQSGRSGSLSYPANTSGYNDTDGRSNTKKLLGLEERYRRDWDSYIRSSDNGHKSSVSGIRKLSDAYKLDAIFTTCLSRNRDLNGNGVIDDNELRWYMPAVNEYIRIGMGANAIPNEAQLYVGDKSALTFDGYPSSFISNGALYHTSTYGGAKVTFWAVEKGSYGDQMSTYNGGRYMIRCIRILPDDVDAEFSDRKVSAAIYQEKKTSNGNYLFDFRGRLTPSLFRQVRNTAPYNFLQHDEDDERNRFYDGLVLAKNYMSNGWSTSSSNISNTLNQLQNIGNNRSNPCASYHEAGEPANAGWRLPNLVEMTVMASNYGRYIKPGLPSNGDGIQGLLPCCTQFSNQAVRQAFYVNTREMVTCGDDYDGRKAFYVRCVRDATDEELATATASSN